MNELLLTDWMPADELPVRAGVYQVDDGPIFRIPWYAYWDGKKFGFRADNPETAYVKRDFQTQCSKLTRWRGTRRWVLKIPAIFGKGYDYVIRTSTRHSVTCTPSLFDQWNGKDQPMSFATRNEVVEYAQKHQRALGRNWKAVLP